MVVDTGADKCFFDHQLAYTIGINPVHGGKMGQVAGITDTAPTAAYPVRLFLVRFDLELTIEDAEFTALGEGFNGLLGTVGFLDQFQKATFIPGSSFELTLP